MLGAQGLVKLELVELLQHEVAYPPGSTVPPCALPGDGVLDPAGETGRSLLNPKPFFDTNLGGNTDPPWRSLCRWLRYSP